MTTTNLNTEMRFSLDRIVNRPLLVTPARAMQLMQVMASRRGQPLIIGSDTAVEQPQARACGMEGYGEDDYRVFSFNPATGIAVIPVEGTLVHRFGYLNPISGMTGYDGISEKIEGAMSDDDVKGIVVDFDSPGGEASGLFDLCDRFLEWRKEKPIVAVINEQASSAAYALASCCSKVYVTQTSRAGSIGVIVVHMDESGWMDQVGLKVEMVFSGSHKSDGNPFEALPDPVRTRIQSEVDSLRELFADQVSRGRGLPTETVLDTEALVYTGQEIVDIGLADEVMSIHEVYEAFTEDLA